MLQSGKSFILAIYSLVRGTSQEHYSKCGGQPVFYCDCELNRIYLSIGFKHVRCIIGPRLKVSASQTYLPCNTLGTQKEVAMTHAMQVMPSPLTSLEGIVSLKNSGKRVRAGGRFFLACNTHFGNSCCKSKWSAKCNTLKSITALRLMFYKKKKKKSLCEKA